MARYFARPRSWVDYQRFEADTSPVESLTVSDHVSTDNGLFDASGDAIMRAPNPIWFGRDDEWLQNRGC